MIHDPHRQTLTAVLHVTHPAYVLLGPGAQQARVNAWGRVLAGLAQSGTCSSIQVLEATIPDSGRGIGEWYEAHGAHRGGWAEEQYAELLSANSTGASTHRTTISYSLDMRAAGGAIKASGGGLVGAAKVLRADLVALEFGLRSAELHFGNWMGEAEIAHAVRSAYDPALGGDFQPSSGGANLSPRRSPGDQRAMGSSAPRLRLFHCAVGQRVASDRRGPPFLTCPYLHTRGPQDVRLGGSADRDPRRSAPY